MSAIRSFASTMPFTRFALAAAFIAFTVAYPNAYASDVSYDQMPPTYGALMKMKPADVMRMMDPDKKGYVTKSDFVKFHEKMAEKMFDRMDKNHDAKLTEDELIFEQSTHTGP